MLRSNFSGDQGAAPSRGPHPLALHLASAWSAVGGDTARMAQVLAGVRRYQTHPHVRMAPDMPVVWACGSTQLLDYAPDAPPRAPVVLLVPSLINRAWVLDLAPDNSLARFLAAQGFRPLLVDWGELSDAEAGFDLDAYVTARLAPLVSELGRHAPVHVLGYCLGGTLAVALACLAPATVASLTLLAAPWDFTGWTSVQRDGLAQLWALHAPAAGASGGLPMEVLQLMFAAIDPALMATKFARFAEMAPDSAAARQFVVLEDWANSGAAMAYPAAEQFFARWLAGGGPAAGWHVGDTQIDPAQLAVPTLALLSMPDRIVPLSVTRPLAVLVPGAQIIEINAGHVGMVVGGRARELVCAPLAAFLQAQSGPVA